MIVSYAQEVVSRLDVGFSNYMANAIGPA